MQHTKTHCEPHHSPSLRSSPQSATLHEVNVFVNSPPHNVDSLSHRWTFVGVSLILTSSIHTDMMHTYCYIHVHVLHCLFIFLSCPHSCTSQFVCSIVIHMGVYKCWTGLAHGPISPHSTCTCTLSGSECKTENEAMNLQRVIRVCTASLPVFHCSNTSLT